MVYLALASAKFFVQIWFCLHKKLREKVYLPSKKSHLDLVNGHFSTQLSAHGPSFAKNVLTGKGVEHRRSKPFEPSLSPQLCPFKFVVSPL